MLKDLGSGLLGKVVVIIGGNLSGIWNLLLGALNVGTFIDSSLIASLVINISLFASIDISVRMASIFSFDLRDDVRFNDAISSERLLSSTESSCGQTSSFQTSRNRDGGSTGSSRLETLNGARYCLLELVFVEEYCDGNLLFFVTMGSSVSSGNCLQDKSENFRLYKIRRFAVAPE